MSEVENAPTGATAAPAPEETAQEQQQTPATAEETATEQPDRPRDEKGRWATQRIGELTRNWRSEQRAHEQTRAEIAQMREQLARLAPKPDPATDFDGYLRDHIEQRVQAVEAERQQRQQQEQQHRQLADLARSFDERVAAFAKDHPDVHDAIDALTGALPDHIGFAIGGMEHGPAVIHHLANNPQELARLQSLPPWQALPLLGRIEAKVSAPKPKPVPGAPAPVPTVGGGNAVQKDPDRMTTKEWLDWRRKELNKR